MKLDFAHSSEPLRKALQALPASIANRVGRRAVAAGADVVQAYIEANTPVGPTGNLLASQDKALKSYRQSDTHVAVVGSVVGKAPHHHLVHDGHIAADGSFVPGNPYLQRATEKADGPAQAAMLAEIEAGVARETKRIAK